MISGLMSLTYLEVGRRICARIWHVSGIPNVEDVALCDETVSPVVKAADAEALPAARDFWQTEIVRYGQLHDNVPLS